MSSFSSDKLLKACSFFGVLAFVTGRVWHEAFALRGGIPMFNFLFFGYSLVVLTYLIFRELPHPLAFRRSASLFLLSISIIVSFLVIFVFYHTGDFYIVDRVDFGSMYFGFIVSSVSYAVLGYLSFVFVRCFSARAVFLMLVLAVLPVFLVTDWTALAIVYRDYLTGGTVNYLLIGDMLVFTYLLYFASVVSADSSKARYYVLWLLIFVALFVNNSRSSLFFFAACFFLAHLIVSLTSLAVRRNTIVLFVAALCLFVILGAFYWREFEYFFQGSRVLSLFFDAGGDGSLQSRSRILEEGIGRISRNYFLGDIAGQVKHAYAIAPLGSYIHNILSFWEQFGLLVFLLYIGAWAFLLTEIFRDAPKNRLMGMVLFFGFLYAIFSMVFARAFVHTVFSSFFVFIACQVAQLSRDNESEKDG